jgi:hypothetical protein
MQIPTNEKVVLEESLALALLFPLSGAGVVDEVLTGALVEATLAVEVVVDGVDGAADEDGVLVLVELGPEVDGDDGAAVEGVDDEGEAVDGAAELAAHCDIVKSLVMVTPFLNAATATITVSPFCGAC